MAAEPVNNSGFFTSLNAAKKKREDDYAAAVAAMTQAIKKLVSDDTAISLENERTGPSTPLLSAAISSHGWATIALEIIKKLKIENPLNTKLLTEVLINTAAYINHEQDKINDPTIVNDGTIQANYEASQAKVETVYGRFSTLSFALSGLSTAVLLGGLAGAIALCVVFPAALIPVIFVAPIIVLASTFVSMIPSSMSETIRDSWKGLDKDLNQTALSFSR